MRYLLRISYVKSGISSLTTRILQVSAGHAVPHDEKEFLPGSASQAGQWAFFQGRVAVPHPVLRPPIGSEVP